MLIEKITLSNHEYSPDGANVFVIAYYTGTSCQSVASSHSLTSKPPSPFVSAFVKELEIQLQFNSRQEMNICKNKIRSAINHQTMKSDRKNESIVRNLSSYLKKNLHMQSILANTIDAENVDNNNRKSFISGHSTVHSRDVRSHNDNHLYSLLPQNKSELKMESENYEGLAMMRSVSSDSENSVTFYVRSPNRSREFRDSSASLSSIGTIPNRNSGILGQDLIRNVNFVPNMSCMRSLANVIPTVSPVRLAISLANSAVSRGGDTYRTSNNSSIENNNSNDANNCNNYSDNNKNNNNNNKDDNNNSNKSFIKSNTDRNLVPSPHAQFLVRDEDDYSIIDNISSENAANNKLFGTPSISVNAANKLHIGKDRELREFSQFRVNDVENSGANCTVRNYRNNNDIDVINSHVKNNGLYGNENDVENNSQKDSNDYQEKNTENDNSKKYTKKSNHTDGSAFYKNNIENKINSSIDDKIDNRLCDNDVWRLGQLNDLSGVMLRSKFSHLHSSNSSTASTNKITNECPSSTSTSTSEQSQNENENRNINVPNNNVPTDNENDFKEEFDHLESHQKFRENMCSESFFTIPIPKMRILLMSVGTFGDVQPFATLGKITHVLT